jgi:hypothetical protein
MDRLRQILDPLGHGVPRRATLARHSKLIVEKSQGNELEIDAISEVCHLLFGNELPPRSFRDLLRRALHTPHNPALWQSMRDDIVHKYPIEVPDDEHEYIIHLLMKESSDDSVFVCCRIVAETPAMWDRFKECFSDIVRVLGLSESDIVASSFREVVCKVRMSSANVANALDTYPYAARLFVGIGAPELAAAYRVDPSFAAKIDAYAMSLPPARRTAHLSILAMLVHSGISFKTESGPDTFAALKKGKHDAKLDVAAAILCQSHADPRLSGMACVIESLASTLQNTLRE